MAAYVPTGSFSTAYKVAQMLSLCATVLEVLEAANAAAALTKITTYSEDEMSLPRCVILEQDVSFSSEDGVITGMEARMLGCEFFFYVPNDFHDPGIGNSITIQDEHSYVLDKFSDILDELMSLVGTNGYVILSDPKLYQPERMPGPERFDIDEVELGDEARSVWFGILGFQIG